jgi:mRNA interferase RelE/StbE
MVAVSEPVVYEVRIKTSALRALNKLPTEVQKRVLRAVATLSHTPRPVGCKLMKGRPGHWRIRLGDYRMIYIIRDSTLTIQVIEVGHRRDIYR